MLDALLEDKGGAWWDEFFALRQMNKTDGTGSCFGEDFLRALLATKEAAGDAA
jgi:hypothetical protein